MESISKDWVDMADTGTCDSRWIFRDYKCEKYMFAEDYDRNEIKMRVLESHRVKDTIEKRKRETGIHQSQSLQEAAQIIDEIAHTFSLGTIRFMAYSLIKIIKKLFQRVLVNKEGIKQFNECAKMTPIVLVPTHSSYFDFLLASAICFALDLPLPAIVAGQDFLNIAVVNHLLRGSGAFYMRRSFASDTFYRSIFTEYVQQILCIGERPVEFFPEGTRSRSGKALQPKLGLLSMVLESCFHGFVNDVSFIPMSISYEKITEEMLYAFELVGIPKPKESLSGLLKARSVLTTDYGTVSVTFGKPMSLMEYCGKQIDGMDYVRIPRCERHLKIFGRGAQEMKIAKYFGEKLIFQQQQNLVIYPRAVVTYIMMSQQNDVYVEHLAFKVDKIGHLLRELGFRTYGFEDLLTNSSGIEQAVKFSDMVLTCDHETKIISRTTSAFTDPKLRTTALYNAFGKSEELLSKSLAYIYSSCQRNKLVHPFLLPSLVLHSIKVRNDLNGARNLFCFLKQVFRIEFIFDPDKTGEQDFNETLPKLQSIGLVSMTTADNQVELCSKCSFEIDFLMGLVQPFLDAYMIVLVSFLHDTFEYPLKMKPMTKLLQLQAAKFINSGKILILIIRLRIFTS
eukprot:TCONS_00052753-protein